jgi:hypothetical protein
MQLDNGLAGQYGAGRMRADFHSVGDRKRTARHQAALAFHFDDAHAAGAAGRQPVDVIERGHFDGRAPQRAQQHLAFFGGYLSAVDLDGNHGVFYASNVYCLTTASKRQASTQQPQPMHLSTTM